MKASFLVYLMVALLPGTLLALLSMLSFWLGHIRWVLAGWFEIAAVFLGALSMMAYVFFLAGFAVVAADDSDAARQTSAFRTPPPPIKNQ